MVPAIMATLAQDLLWASSKKIAIKNKAKTV